MIHDYFLPLSMTLVRMWRAEISNYVNHDYGGDHDDYMMVMMKIRTKILIFMAVGLFQGREEYSVC